jgi:hypothetical protein
MPFKQQRVRITNCEVPPTPQRTWLVTTTATAGRRTTHRSATRYILINIVITGHGARTALFSVNDDKNKKRPTCIGPRGRLLTGSGRDIRSDDYLSGDFTGSLDPLNIWV